MAFKMSGRRARQIQEGTRTIVKPRNGWEAMVADSDIRARLLASRAGLVEFLDLVATKHKPYEGQGWTVFCDWIFDACNEKRAPEVREGFAKYPPHLISELVFLVK